MNDYYFDGDPAVDSTRRHLERVLEGRQSRRWPWVVAALAGGAAFAFWRIRSRQAKPPQTAADAAPTPTSDSQHAR
jgi:hypothetical protein